MRAIGEAVEAIAHPPALSPGLIAANATYNAARIARTMTIDPSGLLSQAWIARHSVWARLERKGSLMRFYTGLDTPDGWAQFMNGRNATFGFVEAHEKKAEKVLAGDRIICFVTGPLRCCGLLEVLAKPEIDDPTPLERVKQWPVRKAVRRLIMLEAGEGLHLRHPIVWDRLSFTRVLSPEIKPTPGKLRTPLNEIPDEDAEWLISLLCQRSTARHVPDGMAGDDYDPTQQSDQRQRAVAAIVVRRGQRAFRSAMVSAYGGRCAFSDCAVNEILEAAHISPHLGPATDVTSNGLLLRSDLHTLLDCGLLSIDPADQTIVVSSKIAATEYASLSGRKVRPPEFTNAGPSVRALEWHHGVVFRP